MLATTWDGPGFTWHIKALSNCRFKLTRKFTKPSSNQCCPLFKFLMRALFTSIAIEVAEALKTREAKPWNWHIFGQSYNKGNLVVFKKLWGGGNCLPPVPLAPPTLYIVMPADACHATGRHKKRRRQTKKAGFVYFLGKYSNTLASKKVCT